MLRFDYTTQAWIRDGKYIDCGHPKTMICGCHGRVHKGEVAPASKVPNYHMGGAVMAKHTPRPWKLEASTNPFEGYMIYGANNKPIGSTFLADGDELTPGDEANAALLVAAPDLLEVLRHALWADICPCCGRDNTGLSQRCTSDDCPGVQAIAKAERS